jgi:hypothetical protein
LALGIFCSVAPLLPPLALAFDLGMDDPPPAPTLKPAGESLES